MKTTKTCGECGARDIRMTTVSAGGGYSPDFLPGAHPWWKGANLEVYACVACGNLQLFVPSDLVAKVAESDDFKKHF